MYLFRGLLVFCLLSINVSSIVVDKLWANDIPKSWTFQIEKRTATDINLHLKIVLPKDWYIYVKAGKNNDIDTLSFSFNDGKIVPSSIRKLVNETVVEDKIFTGKSRVLVRENEWILSFKFADPDKIPAILHANISYQLANAEYFLPENIDINIPINADAIVSSGSLWIENFNLHDPVVNFSYKGASVDGEANNSYLELFFLGFLGGILALLTPCVFPMIPLTISFFSKKTNSRRESIQTAILYGLSIILIYVALSIPFHILDHLNPNILNSIATSPLLNLVFFVLFIVFAISFFGAFEISLPSGLGNMADSQSRTRKGLGIFFMALTLCIVSFSCTGPILGSLLAGSLSNPVGGAKVLSAGLFGFGFALALPFTLLAFFPHSLAKLPKSGSWMSTFKVTLGFFELAFALKFLSNSDLIWHWGILKREIFVGIWVILGLAYFLYLIGAFSGRLKNRRILSLRNLWALIILLFSIYMSLGLPSKPYSKLTLLSGFAPPAFYSIYANQGHCVLNLNCVKDYSEGLILAKKTKKPLLLDFTGWACVNCRKMEENIWSDPAVYELIKENFILVSLYVDDRETLPANQQIYGYKTLSGLKTDIVNIGDKWSIFETENFQNNAQPLYAILSPEEKLLISPVGYLPDVFAYKRWLEQGLQAFNNQ